LCIHENLFNKIRGDRTRFDDAFDRYLQREASSATPQQSPDLMQERAESSEK
jgi:hypothetical protein